MRAMTVRSLLLPLAGLALVAVPAAAQAPNLHVSGWARAGVSSSAAYVSVHNGGAIALGHPLGGTGTKLMATLVHALHARGKRFGLQTMCEGGGIANVTIVEAL